MYLIYSSRDQSPTTVSFVGILHRMNQSPRLQLGSWGEAWRPLLAADAAWGWVREHCRAGLSIALDHQS